MRSGELRHKITIQRKHPVQANEYGEAQPESWRHYAEARASIKPATGGETWVGAQVRGEMTHTIEMWYVRGITTDMRVSFYNQCARVFHILAIYNPGEMNRELRLVCKEVS